MKIDEIKPQLKARVQGLWLPSETEAPWTVPSWTLKDGDVVELRRVLRRDAETPVTQTSLHELMAQIQRRCQGYGDEGKAIARQHETLFEFLQEMSDRWQVFRVGEVTIDIVVVGETKDGYVALQTQSVET